MRTILDVYQTYHIPANLQEHMLRVASVAAMLADAVVGVNKHDVVLACLLHDLGNILKINMDNYLFPEALEPEGLEYWKDIQSQVRQQYGSDVHKATLVMVQELEVGKRVEELVGAIGFLQAVGNAASTDVDRKICSYADMRVVPAGVVSLGDRFLDLRKRYREKQKLGSEAAVEIFEESLRKIEQQLFNHALIAPSAITEAAVQGLLPTLRAFAV